MTRQQHEPDMAIGERDDARHGGEILWRLPAAVQKNHERTLVEAAETERHVKQVIAARPEPGERLEPSVDRRAVAAHEVAGPAGPPEESRREVADALEHGCAYSIRPPQRETAMDLDWLKPRIEKARDVDEALREAAPEICKRFGCDRISIYRATDDGVSLIAVVQLGLESFGAVKVRIDSSRSVAGYVGAQRKLVNIGDAYDEKELAPLAMKQRLFRAVDERTGYKTRQVLAAPIVSAATGKLLGVVELFNRADKQRFPAEAENGLVALCAALAAASW